ncbi:alpha/beta fold hydrolase [Shouchella patagoniensis]|uniref:alpha/beta fold hydrolase n=1 Tax=Shouchella patagoniensis TaxID=228576 RepID=UPI000994EB7B|nr:alpha/beta hydrolase [Shouchella patagoniensis]
MNRTYGEFRINKLKLEYSIYGEGKPILVFHGGHSNCHENFGYDFLVENGFSIITPSRAGYGNTSKEIGTTLECACDYYAALLKHLEIEQIHIIAISAGGPTGIKFSNKFPDLTKSLILQSAVTKEWLKPTDGTYKVAQFLFHPRSEKITWGMISHMSKIFPHFIFKQMFSSFSSLKYKEAKNQIHENDAYEIAMMNHRQRSKHGFLIDLSQTKEVREEDLRAIKCSSLILHSKNDSSVSIEHPNLAKALIPNSELHTIDSWGHLIWLGHSSHDINKLMIEFLDIYESS